MKITVITGSRMRNCASRLLAERFADGAREAGHEAYLFDASRQRVEVCLGCGRCGRGKSVCVRKGADAMLTLAPELTSSQAVAFVIPVDASGLPEILERAVERIYTNHYHWKGGDRKAFLILVPHRDAGAQAAKEFAEHYRWFVDYLGWTDAGALETADCDTRAEAEATAYPEQARLMGASLG